jgi:hypothetical protein
MSVFFSVAVVYMRYVGYHNSSMELNLCLEFSLTLNLIPS